jgi:hypothetical protein
VSRTLAWGLAAAALATVLAAAAATSAAAATTSPFVFQVPPGWRDLTPGVPEDNYRDVHPDVAAQIKDSAPLFFAADVVHARGRFMTNVRATLVGGSGPITEGALRGYVKELQASGAKFRSNQRELDDWNGITVGKIVGVLTVSDQPIAQVAYVVPGADGRVFLTYSTLPEQLDDYLPIFDAAARATQGAVQPISFFERSGVRGTLLAFFGAALLLLIIRRARARRKAAAQQ